MTHEFQLSVFYEDTDMAGIVYYANYLRFIERGRSSMLREAGFIQLDLRDQFGIVFAVTEVNAKYIQPAKLDDVLCVKTQIADMSKVRVVFDQKIYRGDAPIFDAKVTVATMSLEGRPKALPPEARDIFTQFQA